LVVIAAAIITPDSMWLQLLLLVRVVVAVGAVVAVVVS
jgi:hypothetical protein